MSLQVWLPLNEDAHNQGLLNLPTPWTFWNKDSNGKIGECYTDGAIYHMDNEWLDNKWSLACWVKSTGWSQYNDIMLCKNANESTSSQFYFSIIGGTQLNLGVNGGSGVTSYNYTFSTNTWYHVAATYDGTTICLYINGNQVKKVSYSSTKLAGMNNLCIGCRSTNISGTSQTGNANKRLNDVRIYNHCLSPKEVKEISKGLILHYKLDNNNIENYNILTGTYYNSYGTGLAAASTARNIDGRWAAGSGGNGTFSVTEDSTCPIGSYSWNVLNNTSGNRDFQQGDQPYVSGQKYTTSFYAKGNGTCLYRSWNSTDGKQMFQKTWTLTSNWEKYTYTFTASEEMETDSCTFHLGVTGNANISICGMKMELGEKATPYCAAKGEVFDDTKVYDSSGYNNNGTITGSLSVNILSNKYNYCTYITDGNSSYITTPTLNLPGDQITMNFWFKSSNKSPTGGYHMPLESTSSGQYEISIYQTGYLRGGLYVGGSRKVDNCTSTKLTDDDWHMCTMTFDGTTIKRYVDGISEKDTSASGTLPTSASFVIGHYGSNTTYASKEVYESDIRIYTTALSAEDIKELYNTSKLVDNQGNKLAREVNSL